MRPVWTGPPRRPAPDLDPAEPDDRAPLVEPRPARATAMVRFTDRSIHLCRIRAWQQRGSSWLVHLAWDDGGQVRHAWFRYDEKHTGDPPTGNTRQ